MDPLTVFKDFVLNKQLDEVVVDEAEGKVRFADKYSFPANAATAFRREGTAAHYPLGVVVLFFKWQAEGKPITEYIRTYKERTAQVALPDRAVSACHTHSRVNRGFAAACLQCGCPGGVLQLNSACSVHTVTYKHTTLERTSSFVMQYWAPHSDADSQPAVTSL